MPPRPSKATIRYRSANNAPGKKRGGGGVVAVPVPLCPAGEPAAGEREGDTGERDPARDAGVRGAGDGSLSARE